MAIEYLTIPHISTRDITRIFSKIRISDAHSYRGIPCWEWTAMLNKGYGYIAWHRIPRPAYRILYAWLVGPIPKGAKHGELDHLCRNIKCVNPAHLQLVSRALNNLRSGSVTSLNARKTHCKNGHPLDGDNLVPYLIRRGRICRICNKAGSKRRRDRPEAKAKISDYCKRQRQEDPERIRQRDRNYRNSDERKDYMKAYNRQYQTTNREQLRIYDRERNQNPERKEKRRQYSKEYKARKRAEKKAAKLSSSS